jgi:hypothetical protein
LTEQRQKPLLIVFHTQHQSPTRPKANKFLSVCRPPNFEVEVVDLITDSATLLTPRMARKHDVEFTKFKPSP